MSDREESAIHFNEDIIPLKIVGESQDTSCKTI